MKQKRKDQEEQEFFKKLEQFRAWIESPKMYVLDLEKERKVYEVQQKMQAILDEEYITAKVKIKPCPLGMGDVIIEFEGDCVIVRNIEVFHDIIKELSNFELYPTKNGIKFAGVISDVAKVRLL